MVDQTETLYTIAEVSVLFRVSSWTIMRWIKDGKLSAIKVSNGNTRISASAIADLKERSRTDVVR